MTSEVRVIIVERTAIIHPALEESTPLYLVPLWRRPCFTTGKTGIRFDMKKKSVDIFLASEVGWKSLVCLLRGVFTSLVKHVRDNLLAAIQTAAQKTPADSVRKMILSPPPPFLPSGSSLLLR